MKAIRFYPDTQEKAGALNAFAKALKIPFKTEERTYDPNSFGKKQKTQIH
ncbi:DUF2683 family protein [Dyadobacter sp. 32]